MRTAISRSLLDRLLAEAAAGDAREVCGLLFGSDTAIDAATHVRNISSNSHNSFELDPQMLFQVIRAERSGGPCLIGYYHSHPNGIAEPSPRDAADAAADGKLWLLLAGNDARLWRAVEDGAHLGRFDPVALDVLTP